MTAESQSPGIPEAEDWRVAFEAAGSRSSSSRSSDSPSRSSRTDSPMNGRASRSISGMENGDVGNASRRTPGRAAPPPPPTGGSMYKY